MKITDPEVIRNGEKDLIDAVKKDLDLDAIRQILEKKIAAQALTSKGGQIVVHNNEIAFRLDFELNLSGSLMFDRQGNYLPETAEPDMPADSAPDTATAAEDLSVDTSVSPEADEGDESLDDLKIELPDYDLDETELDLDDDLPAADVSEVDPLQDDLIDDDIDDIFAESQEFWEQKKETE